MLRIALLDDHPIVRRGFKQLIESIPGHRVVLEHGRGDELLSDPTLPECDLVVLDLSLPDMDGFDVLRSLPERAPRTRVLVLSMHEELPYVREALALGASGYLCKAAADGELLDALEAVAGGEVFLGSALRTRVAAVAPDRDPVFPELTVRECEIARLLVDGASIRRIAIDLEMSRKTVYAHRSNLLGKLGLGSDVELVQLARRRGLPGST
jgi:DNA-binding NarL/FixJ family response regulator